MIGPFSGKYKIFSNFHPCNVKLDGEIYDHVESAYQAAKTHNPLLRKRIQAAHNPGLAKKFGNELELRSDWEQVKFDVMRDLLRQKFSIPGFREALLETGNEEIVESLDDKENIVGRLLMELRDEFRLADKIKASQ